MTIYTGTRYGFFYWLYSIKHLLQWVFNGPAGRLYILNFYFVHSYHSISIDIVFQKNEKQNLTIRTKKLIGQEYIAKIVKTNWPVKYLLKKKGNKTDRESLELSLKHNKGNRIVEWLKKKNSIGALIYSVEFGNTVNNDDIRWDVVTVVVLT